MIIKILVGSLLALSAVNAIGANMHIYKDKSGKVVQQSKSTTNNVAKFYKPIDWSQSYKNDFEYLKSTEEVKVTEDNDINKTYNLMSANGYTLIGSSVFNDRNLPNSIFISQAKKLGASYVAIYKGNSSRVSYGINDDLNNLDYAYQYAVDFYVKNNFFKKPTMLGINLREIPLEKRVQLQRNTGAYVGNVVKDSRAYFANIVLEDVIIAINGKEVRAAEDLDKLKESELKMTKNLNLTIIRLINNEPKEIQIPVSFN